MKANIVLLPGDGVGPEVVSSTRQVLDAVAKRHGHELAYSSHPIGGIAIDETGNPLPDSTLDAAKKADAILLGAVGGPKWDDPNAKTRPEKGLLAIRQGLGLYANLRPVRSFKELVASSPLKPERIEGVDLLVLRELTGGLYFGKQFREQTERGVKAVDTLEYVDFEIRRVVRLACSLARARKKKVTSVDKANVLESSRLWRQIATEVSKDFGDVAIEHQLVDSCAMRLVTAPGSFDVLVTENMFGDILSDEAAVLTGSLGMLPSASLGEGKLGLYEPIHGSAPDIAGKGICNPIGTILSGAMLLRHSLGLEAEAKSIELAVERALAAGARTKDLGGSNPLSTQAMTDAVLAQLEK
ncbi:MAG: 3-isopropylmalate dehydrogenase [Myxococcota bacterium]|jgi:3-isopropylmalate dehydrogenase|nr:3-isopropylmalate dehydrogenase [Myxococcota bacterium]